MNIFEKASRLKLRFSTSRGEVATEQLWDFNISTLDNMAVAYNRILKDSVPVSFVDKAKPSNTLAQLQFDIVKYILDVRLVERDAKAKREEISSQRKLLKEVIAQREVEEMLKGNPEELKLKLAALEAAEKEL